MTPKACSLYDEIKLWKLRNGHDPHISDIPPGFKVIHLEELKENGFVRLVNLARPGTYKKIWAIEFLR